MPVPGTTTPEPQPVDDEREAAFPRVDDADVGRRGSPAGSGAASRERSRTRAAASRILPSASSAERDLRETGRQRSDPPARAASREISASRATAARLPTSPPGPRKIEEPQRVGDQRLPMTAADSKRLVAPIRCPDRTPADDAIRGEILPADRSAATHDLIRDAGRELAVVEGPSAVRRQVIQRIGQISMTSLSRRTGARPCRTCGGRPRRA